jgi:hypothetical protein
VLSLLHTGWRRIEDALAGHLQAVSWPPTAAAEAEQAAELPPTQTDERSRLSTLLLLYGLEEAPMAADGACQFRALSDQLYRTESYHAAVREAVVQQLRACPERYASFVAAPSFDVYLQELSRPDGWGDNVSLQAAADAFGLRICVLTTYSENAYLEVLPVSGARSERTLWLTLHAEVHYNSLYACGEIPKTGVDRLAQLGTLDSG